MGNDPTKGKENSKSITTAKNIGRGALTQTPYEAREKIGIAFAKLNGDERDEFFKWAASYANSKSKIFSKEPPKDWGALALDGIEGELGFEAQVDWCTRVLQRYIPLLTAYVTGRAAIEKSYLDGDPERALSLIGELEKEVGKSYWSLELRIGILQDTKGLEGHKGLVAEIQAAHPRSAVSFIAAHLSQRNEEKTNLNLYVQRVNSRPLSPYMRDLAHYVLTKINPEPGRMGSLLNAATVASPIDAYETLIGLMDSRRNYRNIPEEAQYLERLSQIAALDWRLHRLTLTPVAKSEYRLPSQPSTVPTPESLYRESVIDSGAIQIHCKGLGQFSEITASIWKNGEATPARLAEHEKNLINHSGITYFKTLWGFYGLDMLRLPTHYTFNISLAGHCLPKTSELGDVQSAHSAKSIQIADQDIWSTDTLSAIGLATGIINAPLTEQLEEILETKDLRWQLRLKRYTAFAKSKMDSFGDAIKDVADLCAEFPDRRYIFPLEDMMPGTRWVDVSEYRDQIDLPIYLSLLHSIVAEERTEKLLRTSFSEFLRCAGLDRPSKLKAVVEQYGKHKVCFLLREVALTNALDSLQVLRSTRALYEERIAVLQVLIELDPDHADRYTDDIIQFTKLIDLADGLVDIDSSRIHVEYDPLLRLAEERYGESFRRYLELRRAEVGIGSAEEFDKALREYLRGGAQTFDKFLDAPEQEGDALLIEIINGITDLFLHDATHGLDIYLSMRIRHGSLATNLRAPLEAVGLHVPERGGDHQGELLSKLASVEAKSAHVLLRDFTRRFEKAITFLLKEKIQIKTGPSGDGLFDFSNTKLLIARVRSSIEGDTPFEQLFSTVFETLAIYLSANLKNVRTYIENDFKQEIEKCFDGLGGQVSRAGLQVGQSRVRVAIAQASPEVSAAIDRISHWFEIGGQSTEQLRSFDDIVDIAFVALKRAHPGFAPQVTKTIENLGLQSRITFNETLDALFPLLENIAEHSGLSEPPINVGVREHSTFDEDGRLVAVRVESDISADKDLAEVERKLAEIRALIASGDYRQRVRGEGGTGLLKIHRLVAQDERQSLIFGVTSAGRFFAEFTMAIRFMSSERSQEMGLA